MKTNTKLNLAFAASIIVSICWLIGDIFIVGFEPDPKKYPLFSQDYASKIDVRMAVHMLEGSTNRLMFGALIGALTAPLLLAATWLVYQLFKDQKKWYAIVTYYILLAGAVLSPLAHAAFFFVGEIFKAIYHINKIAHPQLLEMANGFLKMLYISWGSAIGVLAVGWLGLFISILAKKTILPRWAALITPIIFTQLLSAGHELLPAPYSGYVGAAVFNIAYLLFFGLLFLLFRKRILSSV